MTLLNDIAARGIDWLAESSWQASVLTGLIVLTQWAFRRFLAARWRYLLWMLVIGRLLLPGLPESPASVYRYVPASPMRALPGESIPLQAPPSSLAPGLTDSPGIGPVATTSFSTPSPGIALPGKTCVFMIWAMGCAIFGTAFFVRNFRFYRRLSDEIGLSDPDLERLARETAREMARRRPVTVRETVLVESPAVVGFFQPVLLLPRGIATRLDADELRMVFRHEMAHLKRGDLWTHFAASLLQIVHWFNPILWWAFARLRHDREMATDALALSLSGTSSSSSYGETLLKLSMRPSSAGTLAPSIGILENHRNLKHRLEQIARMKPKAYAWSILGIALIAVLAMIALTQAPTLLGSKPEPIPANLDIRSAYAAELLRAVYVGDIGKVQGILDQGLNPNEEYHNRPTVLQRAISRRYPKIVRLLLSRGAKPDEKAVKTALKIGDKALIDPLLAAGAKIDPLVYAAATGDLSFLKKSAAAQEIPREKLLSILPYGVAAGRISVTDWLWDKTSPWSETERHAIGADLLDQAASSGQAPMLAELKRRGIDFTQGGGKALRSAVWGDRATAVAYLLDNGVALPGDQGAGLLAKTMDSGDYDVARILLAHGVSGNKGDARGETPLMECVSHFLVTQEGRRITDGSDLAFARLLLDHGADPAAKNKFGFNAAWYAAECNQSPEMLELLLKRGGTVTGTDGQGDPILYMIGNFVPPDNSGSPFHYNKAEMTDYDRRATETVRLLVKAGADPNAPGQSGASPLLNAAFLNQYAVALALIEAGADVQAKDKNGNTTLGLALCHAFDTPIHVPLVEALLKKGVDPNQGYYALKKDGATISQPISLIKEAGLLTYWNSIPSETIQAARKAIADLIQSGGKVAAGNDPKTEAWLRAAAVGDLPRLRRLAQEGTPVTTADADNWTALIFSIDLGYDEMTNWLIDHGASLNTVTQEGYSPLSGAIEWANEPLVKRILASEADPTQTPFLDTLVDFALIRGFPNIMRDLVEAGEKPGIDSVFECILHADPAAARYLIDHGAPVDPDNNPEHRGNVYWAVSYNQPEILKMLLEHGADPERKTVYNETPLKEAEDFHHPDLIATLEAAIAERKAASGVYKGPPR